MEFDNIEVEIINRLNVFSKEVSEDKIILSSTDCTKSIKQIIGCYGLELGFGVTAGGDNGFEYEWLYDVTWYETNINGFSNLKLAVESELIRDFGQIKYDFDKLLVTNAEYKIMVCMSFANSIGIEQIHQQCKNSVENYQSLPKGSRFLLLIWDDYGTGKFVPYLITK